MNTQQMIPDGTELVPGKAWDLSDAVPAQEAAGRRIPAKAQPTQPEHDFDVPAKSHAPDEERIAGDPLTEATLGQAEITARERSDDCDPSKLRRAIFADLELQITSARAGEIEYAGLLRESSDIYGPFHAADRVRREMGEAKDVAAVRAGLNELALLAQAGPHSTAAIERILRRKWRESVLPRARALIGAYRERLDTHHDKIEDAKRRLNREFGHLGLSAMIEADRVVETLRRELTAFEAEVSRHENAGPLQGVPGPEVILTFVSRQ